MSSPVNVARKASSGIALALLLALATNAPAATPTKILGFDDMSCQAWAKSKDDGEARTRYVAWVRGVLTGHNYANPAAQVSPISAGTVEGFVNRYCAEKPQGLFSDAAFRMSDQFSGRNAPITR